MTLQPVHVNSSLMWNLPFGNVTDNVARKYGQVLHPGQSQDWVASWDSEKGGGGAVYTLLWTKIFLRFTILFKWQQGCFGEDSASAGGSEWRIGRWQHMIYSTAILWGWYVNERIGLRFCSRGFDVKASAQLMNRDRGKSHDRIRSG